MSQIINTIIPAQLQNSLLIGRDATQRAEVVGLKKNHVPRLIEILDKHKFASSLSPILFIITFIRRSCSRPYWDETRMHHYDAFTTTCIRDSNHAPVEISIAEMMGVDDSIKHGPVPLLWKVLTQGNWVAYEFGIKVTLNAVDTKVQAIPANKWSSFIDEFTNYVQSNELSDIVSLKNRGCLNGGENVSPSQRALFRIPNAYIHLQPGSHNLESGWVSPDGNLQPSDGHVTKTRQTAGGTVAHQHVITEEIGPDTIY